MLVSVEQYLNASYADRDRDEETRTAAALIIEIPSPDDRM